MRILGVDTGGTFTDFVYFDGESIRIHKVLSTPDSPNRAIQQGIAEMAIDPAGLFLIHGSTVATNALLENKGVRTAYIANQGLSDVLTIGRQARAELYDLTPKPIEPPVPAELCFAIDCRIAANGDCVRALKPAQLQRLVTALAQLDIEAVAINLLFSFVDARHERQIAQALPTSLFVSCSADVLPECGEYERGIATWINASLGPLMQRYLQALHTNFPDSVTTVMQSSGGTVAASEAAKLAVHLLLSGPAGGLMAAKTIAATTANPRLLTFDMGGTSTDVALLDGDITLTNEGRIGRYPVAIPMVDMHTIGAGGGSIARIDEGGVLLVGPESAGASPGPACYGAGGVLPTVTDANVFLGRLPGSTALAGHMCLDRDAAQQALQTLAAPLQLTVEQTAQGIIQLANEHMAQALRVISVQRGIDVRDYRLLSFGGAGGLHVCALARLMGMRKAIVPIHSGVLSALGMLFAPRQRVATRTLDRRLDDIEQADIDSALSEIEQQLYAALRAEGVNVADMQAHHSLDLRYQGQSYYLEIPWAHNIEQCAGDFHRRHQTRYGHAMDLPMVLFNVRVKLSGPAAKVQFPTFTPTPKVESNEVSVHGYMQQVPCLWRDSLAVQSRVPGPAVILETVATTFIDENWFAEVDGYGNLLLEYEPGAI